VRRFARAGVNVELIDIALKYKAIDKALAPSDMVPTV
jgi:hypothetical protein